MFDIWLFSSNTVILLTAKNLATLQISRKKIVKVKVSYFYTLLAQHAWGFRILIIFLGRFLQEHRIAKPPQISVSTCEFVVI